MPALLLAQGRVTVYGILSDPSGAAMAGVFNEVNLGKANGTLSCPNFGKITSAGAPGILQFGMKYLF